MNGADGKVILREVSRCGRADRVTDLLVPRAFAALSVATAHDQRLLRARHRDVEEIQVLSLLEQAFAFGELALSCTMLGLSRAQREMLGCVRVRRPVDHHFVSLARLRARARFKQPYDRRFEAFRAVHGEYS